MIAKVGIFFADKFRSCLPNSFVFAILLTFFASIAAFFWIESIGLFDIILAWQKGFWALSEFGMQMILILVTGFAIAISPPAVILIDWLSQKTYSPTRVYCIVVLFGSLFTLISWGWIVMTAILARELAKRISGIDYRLLAACVYVSFLPWHGGLSGSIPLQLNSPDNFFIKQGILSYTLSTTFTLASPMNLICNTLLVLTLPILMLLLRPKTNKQVSLKEISLIESEENIGTIAQEAKYYCLPEKNISDTLNNSKAIQFLISAMGISYIAWKLYTKNFNLDLNFVIWRFLDEHDSTFLDI